MGGVRVALGWCDISLSYLWSSFFLEEQNCFYGTVKLCPLAYGGVSESRVRAFGAYIFIAVCTPSLLAGLSLISCWERLAFLGMFLMSVCSSHQSL